MGKDWWNTPTAAWAFTIIGIGGGVVLTYLSPLLGILVGIIIIGIGIWLLIRAYRMRGMVIQTGNDKIVQPIAHPTNIAKAEIEARIPGSLLTPAVNIVRHEYVLGKPATLRVEYIASSTEVLANFQREAKLRIQQGSYQEDILPVSIAPGQFGSIANTADYRIPPGLSGELTMTPIVTTLDGNQVNNQPYIIHI